MKQNEKFYEPVFSACKPRVNLTNEVEITVEHH